MKQDKKSRFTQDIPGFSALSSVLSDSNSSFVLFGFYARSVLGDPISKIIQSNNSALLLKLIVFDLFLCNLNQLKSKPTTREHKLVGNSACPKPG